jgi:hypothetical protein
MNFYCASAPNLYGFVDPNKGMITKLVGLTFFSLTTKYDLFQKV